MVLAICSITEEIIFNSTVTSIFLYNKIIEFSDTRSSKKNEHALLKLEKQQVISD